ncbi:MAG: dTDP-4-dehydrorhamnose 3,5-epimerase [Phycisphaeraceae bacterium]|nr:dTDP-4-dehydrorhamnose 3,5-epimerase [Phycisphaeraceae bacterium]
MNDASSPSGVPTFGGSVEEAFEEARQASQPRFVPVSVFADDRGWSLMNLLRGVMSPKGQVNFSVQYPGVVKAWHRHARQTDFWICLTGNIKVGVFRQEDSSAWWLVTGEKRPGIVVIPPPLWHGAATVGPTSAGLFYYVTHAYSAEAPDEERAPHDAFSGFPWAVKHR